MIWFSKHSISARKTFWILAYPKAALITEKFLVCFWLHRGVEWMFQQCKVRLNTWFDCYLDYMQSRRHGGALVGLAPQTKLQAPPNWNVKHCELWNFCQIWMSIPTCMNVKLPYWWLYVQHCWLSDFHSAVTQNAIWKWGDQAFWLDQESLIFLASCLPWETRLAAGKWKY